MHSQVLQHPLVRDISGTSVKWKAALGFPVQHTRTKPGPKLDYEEVVALPGFQGTPPMVYGVAWNPFKPQVRREQGPCALALALVAGPGFFYGFVLGELDLVLVHWCWLAFGHGALLLWASF